MPPVQGWFKSNKPLRVSRKAYYEDVYGRKNPEEDLQGVHVLDSESDSDTEFFSRRARRQGRRKPGVALRNSNNKDQSDRKEEMEIADSHEIVAPRVDRHTVVTIDDDDSEVGQEFVADLRNHAQKPSNQHIEDDMEVAPATNNQNEIDAAFMEEVKRYAAQPPPIVDESNDELLKKINGRAESFANQSPLRSKQTFEREFDAANPATVLPSIEDHSDASLRRMPDDRSNSEAPGEPSDRISIELRDGAINTEAVGLAEDADRTSNAVVIKREHSWDPSQGSDYVYSDEEAESGLKNDSYQQDNDLLDVRDEDQESQTDDAGMGKTQNGTHDKEQLIDQVQRETSDGTAELVSTEEGPSVGFEDDNENLQEVVDLTSPIWFSSEEPPSRRPRSSRLDFSDRDSSTSSEPNGALNRTRKRRFGLFASSTRPIVDPDLSELSDDARPRRLHDLVLKRRREKAERGLATKRARYNLRPRQQQESYSKDSLSSRGNVSADNFASEIDSETQEVQAPRRITRSMASRKSVKRPIPRFKAARKSAWPLVPSDNTYRRPSRQIVQVVVPKIIDRSTWGVPPSSTSSRQIERRQSPGMNKDPVTLLKSEKKTEPALAGKGMKRMTPSNDDKEKKQELPFVLIE